MSCVAQEQPSVQNTQEAPAGDKMSTGKPTLSGKTSSAEPKIGQTMDVVGGESGECAFYTRLVAMYDMHCPPVAKELINEHVKPLSCKLSTFSSKYVTPNMRELHLAHGAAILVWGGSHYWLALLMAFGQLYGLENPRTLFKVLENKPSDAAPKSGFTPTNLRTVIFSVVNLLVCLRAVCYSDFFAAVAVACALEGQVMMSVCCANVHQQLLASIESTGCVPKELKSTVQEWLPFCTMCVFRLVLTLFSWTMPYTTACVFLAVYGANKIYNHCSATMQKTLSKPVTSMKVEAQILLISGMIVLSWLWQLINAYESNVVFNLFVPLGFLLPNLPLQTSTGNMKQS